MNIHVTDIQSPSIGLDPNATQVKAVTQWTDNLFSFRVARPQSLRFRSGEFVMIGLQQATGKPLLRAYSIASPAWDDALEFYSIIVDNGPLTSQLRHIEPGDFIIVRPKPTGTLVLDALLPGKRLFMLATGTGIAPFVSLVRDPETYEKYDQVILAHTCRTSDELAYGKNRVDETYADLLIGEEAKEKLVYYPTTTREESRFTGRITQRLESGAIYTDIGINAMDPSTDRIMICGSMSFNHDIKAFCLEHGFSEGSNANPGNFVLEKAFVGE